MGNKRVFKNWKEVLDQFAKDRSVFEKDEYPNMDAVFTEFWDFKDDWRSYDGGKFKRYWVSSWYCTDTTVGLAIYTFEDEPFAVSYQWGRKTEEVVYFISKEPMVKVYTYLKSLEEETPLTDSFLDLEQPIPVAFFTDHP